MRILLVVPVVALSSVCGAVAQPLISMVIAKHSNQVDIEFFFILPPVPKLGTVLFFKN